MLKMRSKLLVALSVAAIGATSAQATPAFARQMNQDCMSCHAQQLPMLNSYGRAFKLSSFSMQGDQPDIADMTLARALNAGVGFKGSIAQASTKGQTSTTDSIAIPSGIAILLGGRVGEGKGVNMLFTNAGVGHLQASFSQDALGGRIGMVGIGTSGHGAFIGTESYNTGLHKELGMFASANVTNAAQATGVGMGPATGLTAFYGGHGLTAAVGYWALGFNSNMSGSQPDAQGPLNTSYRVTYDLPTIAGFDIMVGTYGSNGTTRVGSSNLLMDAIVSGGTVVIHGQPVPSYYGGLGAPTDITLNMSGFDFQVMGDVAKDLNLMVIGQFVNNFKVATAPVATGTSTTKRDVAATSVEAQLMMANKVGVRVAYLSFDDKSNANADYTAMTFGVQYNAASNVNFSIEHASIDNSGTTPDQKNISINSIIVF